MTNTIDVTGKTEEEAIASALAQLGLERDDVSIEIKQRSKSGFLGIGSAPAIVAVTYEVPDAPAAPKPEPEKPAPAAKPARSEKSAKSEKKSRSEKPAAEKVPAPAAGTIVAAPINREGTQEERTRAFLTGLLAHMGVTAEIAISPRENGGLDVALSGENMGAIIGRRGETLDAIQHLTNYSVNRGSEKRMHINVDAENYRSKREESLVHLAEKMAAKAVKYRRSMALEPMNSYERHIIHTALQDGVHQVGTHLSEQQGIEPAETRLEGGIGAVVAILLLELGQQRGFVEVDVRSLTVIGLYGCLDGELSVTVAIVEQRIDVG